MCIQWKYGLFWLEPSGIPENSIDTKLLSMEMTSNGFEWLRMTSNRFERLRMASNDFEWLRMSLYWESKEILARRNSCLIKLMPNQALVKPSSSRTKLFSNHTHTTNAKNNHNNIFPSDQIFCLATVNIDLWAIFRLQCNHFQFPMSYYY